MVGILSDIDWECKIRPISIIDSNSFEEWRTIGGVGNDVFIENETYFFIKRTSEPFDLHHMNSNLF